jgi:23S rRNA (uracil1939-C5)-methyltransferase
LSWPKLQAKAPTGRPTPKLSKAMSEDLLVDIERILPGGVGLAHAEGKTVFVALAAPGDRLRVTIDREQGKLLFASIKEIISPSPVRVEPPCPYFGRCGGCDFQQMTYEAQLHAKAEIIRDCLHRIAGIDPIPDFVVRPSTEWRYRGRAVWQIDLDKKMIGYYERGSRRVCDVADCAVLVPELQETLEDVRATLHSSFPPGLKHLQVVRGDNGVSVAPEFDGFETKELSLKIGDEVYIFNAEAFFQINQELLQHLVDFALESAKGESALDLYCGVGLFTLPLARRFNRVIAVESHSVAAHFARKNIQKGKVENTRVVTTTVTQWMETESLAGTRYDFVLLDPPRAGAESAVINGILKLAPARVSYVSCDPATLARDLKKLLAGGYEIDSMTAFDMFPQTHHVETVVLLTRATLAHA